MNRNSNIDGFSVRRRAQNSDLARQRPSLAGGREVPERFLINPARTQGRQPETLRGAPVLSRATGPATLGKDSLELPEPVKNQGREQVGINLDLDDKPTPKQQAGKRVRGGRKPGRRWTRKKIILTVLAVILAILLAVGGYFVYKFLTTSGKIFQGNVITALFDQGKPLKEDKNGRSNILLFGTSEDDPGHPGADL